jgi:alpha/beta superfamily hydrolase
VNLLPVAIATDDDLTLEAELAPTETDAALAVVLCHPHPQYGGTMRSLVISVLFAELPAAGYPCLRFNFRGVEQSAGAYSHGVGESLDVVAAVTKMTELNPGVPVALVGWSFGADIALGVDDDCVAGWVGIAPPLRFRSSFAAAPDPRPKHLVLAEHDEYRAPADVVSAVSDWRATTTTVIPGASHFFVGRTDRVVTETLAGITRIATPEG